MRKQIETRQVVKGDRLMPERQLSSRFGVSRARLRQALKHLEDEGLLFRRRGQGTFVKPPPATDAARLKPMADRISPEQMMEVRLALEPALAGLAARRADEKSRRGFAQLAQDSQIATDFETYEATDDLFHYKIAEMAQNPLYLMVYEVIRSVRSQADWSDRRSEVFSSNVLALLGAQHQKIAEAILRGDSQDATDCMAAHLQMVAKVLQPDAAKRNQVL